MQICDNRIKLAANLRDEASSSKLEVDSFKSATSMQEIRGIATISGTHGGAEASKDFSTDFPFQTKNFPDKSLSKTFVRFSKAKSKKSKTFPDTAQF